MGMNEKTLHIVIHQDRVGDTFFVHECVRRWSIPLVDGAPKVVSQIFTGHNARILYGSDNPEIHRRVDRIKKRYIDKGIHFACGPLLSAQPRIRQTSERLNSAELHLVGQLYFALAANPRFALNTKSSTRSYTSIPGTHSRWHDYQEAHRKQQRYRLRALNNLLSEVWEMCSEYLPDASGPKKRLMQGLSRILKARAAVRQGGARPRYPTAKALTWAMAAEILDVSPKTLQRRVKLISPYEATLA